MRPTVRCRSQVSPRVHTWTRVPVCVHRAREIRIYDVHARPTRAFRARASLQRQCRAGSESSGFHAAIAEHAVPSGAGPARLWPPASRSRQRASAMPHNAAERTTANERQGRTRSNESFFFPFRFRYYFFSFLPYASFLLPFHLANYVTEILLVLRLLCLGLASSCPYSTKLAL